jgi:hypothetical protein
MAHGAITMTRGLNWDTRMLWMSLRRENRSMTAGELQAFWRPTFSAEEVDDALQRLLAGKHIETGGRVVPYYYVSDDCQPLPGYAEPEAPTRVRRAA